MNRFASFSAISPAVFAELQLSFLTSAPNNRPNSRKDMFLVFGFVLYCFIIHLIRIRPPALDISWTHSLTSQTNPSFCPAVGVRVGVVVRGIEFSS